jgi:hypothetical protein
MPTVTCGRSTTIGLYGSIPVELKAEPTPLWILNASSRPYVDLLPNEFCGSHNVVTRYKFGQAVKLEPIIFPVTRLEVEIGGSLEII